MGVGDTGRVEMEEVFARVIEQSVALAGVILGAYIVWYVYSHKD